MKQIFSDFRTVKYLGPCAKRRVDGGIFADGDKAHECDGEAQTPINDGATALDPSWVLTGFTQAGGELLWL